MTREYDDYLAGEGSWMRKYDPACDEPATDEMRARFVEVHPADYAVYRRAAARWSPVWDAFGGS